MTEHTCPDCGKPLARKRDGLFVYMACTNPKCPTNKEEK